MCLRFSLTLPGNLRIIFDIRGCPRYSDLRPSRNRKHFLVGNVSVRGVQTLLGAVQKIRDARGGGGGEGD